MKKTKSVVFKLSALIIGVFLLLFSLYAVGTSLYTHSIIVKSAEGKAADNTELVALKLSEQFQTTGESLMTTKRMLETMNSNAQLAAQEVLPVLEANLEGNPNAVSMTAIFEKAVLSTDGLTAGNKQLLDTEGRFIPYLLKTKDGLQIQPAIAYDAEGEGDWYLKTKEDKKPFLQEPMTYELAQGSTTVTSMSVPLITKNGEFMGILSATISLDFLKQLTADTAPHGGYASVISDDGLLIENSLKEKMNNTNMRDAIDWDPVKDKLSAGELVTMYVDSKSYNERAFNTFAPLTIDGFDQTWTVQTVLPRSEIITEFTRIIIFTIIAAVAMVVLMGVTTALFVHRRIRPLTVVQQSMEQAATGDLSQKFDTSSFGEDEIGSVANSYQFMRMQTNEALAEVLDASGRLSESSVRVSHAFEEIVASSQEVSVATGEIAEGAAKQSEDTEETSHRMGGLADQINAITAISDDMDELSRRTVESTQTGMAEVERLRAQNDTANRMNDQVEQQMTALTGKISGINQVITSIQDITAQTNLLALNASIEAARAGEHGKGFAVVAEEVRKLAEQSSRETGIIQQTVQEILDQSKATVEVIAENTKSMKDQSASVASTGDSFVLNAELTERMNAAIEELSGSLKEMAAHKDQAVLAIQSVSAVSEETAASAEQVSASSVAQQRELERVAESVQLMTRIAGELQLVVDRFKLSGSEKDA